MSEHAFSGTDTLFINVHNTNEIYQVLVDTGSSLPSVQAAIVKKHGWKIILTTTTEWR